MPENCFAVNIMSDREKCRCAFQCAFHPYCLETWNLLLIVSFSIIKWAYIWSWLHGTKQALEAVHHSLYVKFFPNFHCKIFIGMPIIDALSKFEIVKPNLLKLINNSVFNLMIGFGDTFLKPAKNNSRSNNFPHLQNHTVFVDYSSRS